jgi:hypothetical protein
MHRKTDVTDHDVIVEMSNNFAWIKENLEDIQQRVGAVEKKVWYGAGVMGVTVFLIELYFKR